MPDAARPILLHTHVSYITDNPLGPMHSSSTFEVEYVHHMTVRRSGTVDLYAFAPDRRRKDPSDPADEGALYEVSGVASVDGRVDTHSADGSWSKGHLDKAAVLDEAAYPDRLHCITNLPAGLAPGEAPQVEIDCSALVVGPQEVHGQIANGPGQPPSPVATHDFPAIFLACDDQAGEFPGAPPDAWNCHFSLTLVAPGTPGPGGAPPPPAVQASTGLLYGATTSYDHAGYFTVSFDKSFDLPATTDAPATIAIAVSVWTSAPGDARRPAGVKPFAVPAGSKTR